MNYRFLYGVAIIYAVLRFLFGFFIMIDTTLLFSTTTLLFVAILFAVIPSIILLSSLICLSLLKKHGCDRCDYVLPLYYVVLIIFSAILLMVAQMTSLVPIANVFMVIAAASSLGAFFEIGYSLYMMIKLIKQ